MSPLGQQEQALGAREPTLTPSPQHNISKGGAGTVLGAARTPPKGAGTPPKGAGTPQYPMTPRGYRPPSSRPQRPRTAQGRWDPAGCAPPAPRSPSGPASSGPRPRRRPRRPAGGGGEGRRAGAGSAGEGGEGEEGEAPHRPDSRQLPAVAQARAPRPPAAPPPPAPGPTAAILVHRLRGTLYGAALRQRPLRDTARQRRPRPAVAMAAATPVLW